MGPATIGAMIPIASFVMIVLIVYFAVHRKHVENVELIKRGINPEKYNIKLPGRLGLPLGVVFLALGTGPLIAQILTGRVLDRGNVDELGLALASLIGGIGLIIYWKLTADDRERALKIKEELLLRPGPDFTPDAKPEE